ncbi:MAG: DUF3465 domain-containing protein [Bdellovibrio sp.]|nr:DUF3465 domain-containing protein [Bdellovibrio sp.]
MTPKQKIINLISLVLLILVFWNFFKSKAPTVAEVETKPASELTAFEKGLDCKCDQSFVITPALKVIKKLKDDNQGIRHQKWLVQSPAGQIILFVHNLELCQPLDIEKNDMVQLAGEFKWTDKGALIHWAHFDPKKKRPDGYVEFKRRKYCSTVKASN